MHTQGFKINGYGCGSHGFASDLQLRAGKREFLGIPDTREGPSSSDCVMKCLYRQYNCTVNGSLGIFTPLRATHLVGMCFHARAE